MVEYKGGSLWGKKIPSRLKNKLKGFIASSGQVRI
jgi:hypothetical protein